MREVDFFHVLLRASFALAAVTALYLLFVPAPYGRHTRRGFGPLLPSAGGWLLMEAPAAIVPIALFAVAGRTDVVTFLLLVVWESHYLDRAFLYPLRVRGRGAPLPLLVALSGAMFNVLNGYLSFRYLTWLAPEYPVTWLSDPRFALGLLLFVVGFAVNRQSDRILRKLREPGESSYKIPHGGLYRWVSCPNYLGELVQWCGWALMTFHLPGLFFAVFTAANLVPRALAHHRDYRARFPEYPKQRRAVIPYLL